MLFSSQKAVVGIALFVAILATAFLFNRELHPEDHVLTFSGGTMGTSYHIKVVFTGLNVDPDNIQSVIDQTLSDVDAAMSTYKKMSELSRFNDFTTNEWFPLSQQTYEVVRLGLRISRESEGAYDMTVGPLVNLWGFGPDMRPTSIPDQNQLDEVKKRVGYRFLELAEDGSFQLRKSQPVYLDLSSIAKGYAVDKVAEQLQALGISRYMVEVGGEIRVNGLKEGNKRWRLAIEAPDVLQRTIHSIIEASNISIATSGDYRNYYEEDGKRLSHTIDPHSGRPISHRTASVTVIRDNCAEADAYATLLMVLGYEKGLLFAEKHGIEAYFIVREGGSFSGFGTDSFKKYLVQ